jgi:hypothetical protein
LTSTALPHDGLLDGTRVAAISIGAGFASCCADGRSAESGCAIVALWASTFTDPTGGAADGGRMRTTTPTWPGSVGAIGWMCRPHCWQYAKPVGVDVPQRGQMIVLGAARAAEIGAGVPDAVVGAAGSGVNGIGVCALGAASCVPHARQNFMPGGFSPWHAEQKMGNPATGTGVCWTAGARALPQFKQNDDPGGLSWPQTTHLMRPPRVWLKRRRTGMAPGGFATHEASC